MIHASLRINVFLLYLRGGCLGSRWNINVFVGYRKRKPDTPKTQFTTDGILEPVFREETIRDPIIMNKPKKTNRFAKATGTRNYLYNTSIRVIFIKIKV